MSTRTTRYYEQSRAALCEDPIPEIQRRLVAIHSVITEATDDDREIRSWSAQQIMQLMQDVDDAVKARPSSPAQAG